ncbi:MAG: hypothetical protein Q8R25_03910 [bacterium]|nr:hypothetical protein [bacterium]
MKAHISDTELVEAFSVSSVTEIYGGPLELTDVSDVLETKGRILMVRGDLAPGVPNAKGFVSPYLIKRMEAQMREHPDYALFDGVGPSSLEADHFYAELHDRRTVFVIAKEFELPPHVASWGRTEFIRGEEQAEWGYVRKMAEVLRTRTDLIPLHQAFYGAWAMAHVGNRVVQELEKLGVRPDASVFVAASGSSLWGIGNVLANRFSSETIMVTKTVSVARADLKDADKMRSRARDLLKQYSIRNPSVSITTVDAEVSPLHMVLPSVALLRLVALTGKPGIDLVQKVEREDRERVQERLRTAGHNWTGTTAMALVPAIQLANQGKTVVTMVYGKGKD